MKQKAQTSRFKAFNMMEVRRVFIANTLIAIFLTAIFYFQIEDKLIPQFFTSFIFSQCIGGTIYVFMVLTGVERIQHRLVKGAALTGIFILSGWVGTTLAYPLLWLIFGLDFYVGSLGTFYMFTAILALAFGTIVTAYFSIRERLEEAAAKLAQKEVDEQRLLRSKVHAELQALRAKLDPHFLFNTLNSIASLIPVDPQKAEDMVQKLASLFHQTLESSSKELVPLSDELKMIRQYLEIEKVRLGDRLRYDIRQEESLDTVMIPGLLLQPLVENSVRHGIAPLEDGGSISIACSQEDTRCRIEIQDSGDGFSDTEYEAGFGLQSVSERLALQFPGNYEFQIMNESGVRILIHVPLDGRSHGKPPDSHSG